MSIDHFEEGEKMRSRILSVLVGLSAVVLCSSFTQAQVVGIDWFGGGGGGGTTQEMMAPSEVAGVAPRANWNSFTGLSQATPQNLLTDAGAAAGNVVWASNNTWNTQHV